MLDAIKRFFREGILETGAGPASEDRQQALRLATAALLFEVVRADYEVKDEERTVMRAAIQGTFGLSAEESAGLMGLAEERARSAVSLYEFTSVVDKGFSADEKKRIVELMWLVSFADTEKHPLEEQMIRRIAGLLNVPHPDFIDAKLRAKAKGTGGE